MKISNMKKKSNEKDLTPIGTKVTLTVNPEKPEQLMEELKDNGKVGSFFTSLLFSSFAVLIYLFLLSSLPELKETVLTNEIIHKLMIDKSKTEFITFVYFITMSIFHGVYFLFLPSIYKGYVFALSILCALISFIFGCYVNISAKRKRYHIITETITNIYPYKDSLGYTHYRVVISSEKFVYEVDRVKNDIEVGDILISVYSDTLLYRKKPSFSFLTKDGLSTLF